MTTPSPARAATSRVSTAAAGTPIIPIILAAAGGYLMWFGIHYWRGSGDLVWPSTPVKAVLQGKPLPSNSPATTADVQLTAYETSLASTAGGGGSISGPEPSGPAQNMARLLLSKYGWAASEMAPLIALWTRESGWNPNARNPSSGAYGIAQALGHGGPGTAAPDGTNEYGAQYGLSDQQAQQANGGSALWQIRWGLGYIKSRYGSPSAAESHEQAAGWY